MPAMRTRKRVHVVLWHVNQVLLLCIIIFGTACEQADRPIYIAEAIQVFFESK